MKWLNISVVFVCILVSSCKTDAKAAHKKASSSGEANDGLSISPRLVGGADAPDDLAPYQCSLQFNSDLFCGCVIISSEWVLTAAHCIVYETFNFTASKIQIVAGTNEWKTGTHYNVSKIIINEKFVLSDYINDIALIRARTPIEFNERVQPINFTSKAVQPDTLLQTTGWGTLKARGPRADKLQVLYVKSISSEECKNKSQDYIDESHLCTLSPKKQGMCIGDSGGPLVDKNNELVGITSWSVGCGLGLPEAYTKISHLYEWIVENIQSK